MKEEIKMLQCLCSSADGMKDVGLIRLHVLRDVSLGWVSLLPTKYYKTTGAVSSPNTHSLTGDPQQFPLGEGDLFCLTQDHFFYFLKFTELVGTRNSRLQRGRLQVGGRGKKDKKSQLVQLCPYLSAYEPRA